MIATLEELVQYIRETLPQPKSIQNLQIKEPLGVVSFIWHGREFLVKTDLNVLEVRGKNLYLTGASTLLQSVLMKRGRSEKVLETAIEALGQVEDLINVKHQTEAGLRLLGTVKSTLGKLAGQ